MIGDLVPVCAETGVQCPATIISALDVGAWQSIAWSITARGTAGGGGVDYIWLAETWGFPGDVDDSIPPALTQPGASHALQYIDGLGQLYATTPRSPLLTLSAFQPHGNVGNRFDIRVWVSRHRLTPYHLWPASFTLAEASAVAASSAETLVLPAYEGPVVCHAWASATDPSSRIDLRNMRPDATAVRTHILWKPDNATFNRNPPATIVLPPGANTVDLVNNDGVSRIFDVAFTPLPW